MVPRKEVDKSISGIKRKDKDRVKCGKEEDDRKLQKRRKISGVFNPWKAIDTKNEGDCYKSHDVS